MELADPELVTILRLQQFELEQNLPAKRVEQHASEFVISPAVEPAQPPTTTSASPARILPFLSQTKPIDHDRLNSAASSIASASASAAAYANRLLKTGFARLHAENTPYGHVSNDEEEATNKSVDSSANNGLDQ